MRTVKLQKDRLLKTLEENKKDHRADFEIAWEAYKERVISNTTELLNSAKDLKQGEAINLYIGLEAPEDHTDDYDRAIDMLDWEVESEVTLTEQEFKQYVQDEWGWSASTKHINALYTGSATPSKSHI